MIRNGLRYRILYNETEPRILKGIVKTETRRLKRGYYKLESERKKPHDTGYAVQRKRDLKAEPDIRIVFDRIWKEEALFFMAEDDMRYPVEMSISKESAWAEGGYTPDEYEKVFRALNPKWDSWSRWAFKFHAIEVRK